MSITSRYGVGPYGLGVEPKPSVAIHTIRSQRCVVAAGSFGTPRRRPAPVRGRGPPGQPSRGTGAVATLTG